MAVVVWHVTMSLDGFIAGPDEAMEWVFEYFSEESSETAGEVIETTGAIIMGRHTYEVEDRYRHGIYGGAWTGPFFVLTHEPPAVVPDWMTGTFIDEDIEAAVARAMEAAGGKTSASSARTLPSSASTMAYSTRSSSTSRRFCSAMAYACSQFPAVGGSRSSRPESTGRAS
jgi:RibD C-terminal domain